MIAPKIESATSGGVSKVSKVGLSQTKAAAAGIVVSGTAGLELSDSLILSKEGHGVFITAATTNKIVRSIIVTGSGGSSAVRIEGKPEDPNNTLNKKLTLESTILTGVAVAALAGLVPLESLAKLVNIGTLFAFMLVSIGVLVLRYKEPDRPRPFRVPLVWPVCIGSAAGCLFIMQGLPHSAWERFGIWLIIGLLLYFFYGYRHSKLRQGRG